MRDETEARPVLARGTMARALWTITLLLVLIGIAVAVRRMLHLFAPSPAPPRFAEAAALDSGFDRHRVLTMVHILPGLLFLVLAPLQFLRGFRARHIRMHRWVGRAVLVCGAIVGATALIMSPRMAIGGANETAATMLFAVVFLYSLAEAYRSIRRRKIALHREWMIRAFAIGLAIATIRPIVGVFFATSRLTHLKPHDFFGIAFWLGFTIHLLAAQAWIDYTRGPVTPIYQRPQAQP